MKFFKCWEESMERLRAMKTSGKSYGSNCTVRLKHSLIFFFSKVSTKEILCFRTVFAHPMKSFCYSFWNLSFWILWHVNPQINLFVSYVKWETNFQEVELFSDVLNLQVFSSYFYAFWKKHHVHWRNQAVNPLMLTFRRSVLMRGHASTV